MDIADKGSIDLPGSKLDDNPGSLGYGIIQVIGHPISESAADWERENNVGEEGQAVQFISMNKMNQCRNAGMQECRNYQCNEKFQVYVPILKYPITSHVSRLKSFYSARTRDISSRSRMIPLRFLMASSNGV